MLVLMPDIEMTVADGEGVMDVGPTYAPVYPAVQNFVLAARALGLGTADDLCTHRGRDPRDLRHPRRTGRGPLPVGRPRGPSRCPRGEPRSSPLGPHGERRPPLTSTLPRWPTGPPSRRWPPPAAPSCWPSPPCAGARPTGRPGSPSGRSWRASDWSSCRPAHRPDEKVGFIDGHRCGSRSARLRGGDRRVIYMSFTVRNVGNGIGCSIGGTSSRPRWTSCRRTATRPSSPGSPVTSTSRPATWGSGRAFTERGPVHRGAAGDRAAPGDPHRPAVRGPRGRSAHDQPLLADPVAEDRWLTSVARHWNLDRDDLADRLTPRGV